ncbi:MAG: DUF2225 domain-containing protein [Lachnospiraceae bacterium]|nr:DUF2225 domain-containing protein [Lachnospiraceae bacterium]MBP5299741.1 DUF2225 domain-containing protein [Lachnospiraceae bacterium]
MTDLFSGLSSMGLGNIEKMDLFEKPKEVSVEGPKKPIVVEEKDILFDKGFECPVCDSKITAKNMKTGKAKMSHQDMDLRTVFEGIDITKYDVIVCPVCGYAALTRFHKPMSPGTAKLIKDNISVNFRWEEEGKETYSYEFAFKRYQLALANAMVRKAKDSEKAFICLKTAWLMRGWNESLDATPENAEMKKQIQAQEMAYLKNAFDGFMSAVGSESGQICGMDANTIDYLLAVLAYENKQFETSSKLVAKLLTNPSTPSKTKDKLRDLKDKLLEELKK